MGFQKGNTLGSLNTGRRKEGRIEINAEYHRLWRKKNPESFKKSQYKFKTSDHGKRSVKNTYLKSHFGITIEEYDALLIKQQHKCAICGKHQSELYQSFDVDHNHETKKVRGLLCNQCNQGIGYLQESIEIITKSLEYLRRDNGEQQL